MRRADSRAPGQARRRLAHPARRRAGRGRHRRRRRLLYRCALLAVPAVAVLVSGDIASVRAAGHPSQIMPTAGPGRATAVGALFSLDPGGQLGSHFCTGSVVSSPGGDLVLTAAHCMIGRSARAVAFVPAFADGREPFGIWPVTRIIVDQGWQSLADPADDFAFLVVSQPGTAVRLQSLTGAEHIGIGMMPGAVVTVAGYPSDLNSQISCRNTALPFGPTQLEFDCGGYTDGTSGGPLLTGAAGADGAGTVVGVIGGYQMGGDTPSVSYAARFGVRMAALYRTALAESGG